MHSDFNMFLELALVFYEATCRDLIVRAQARIRARQRHHEVSIAFAILQPNHSRIGEVGGRADEDDRACQS
ncbi:hypothetical protein AAV28_35865 [Bradyrhizobium diazoefficiens USDA 110]|nr:hypothetical protein AAV28_35865 [Bradyrhizobium diazoefficiens USDA 110]APO52173.1 hypothetical protein BD122_17890 [Bradyrhizobium diazoefficiens]KOY04904.1 hypothetical protein AF336_39495 [Bradyrhizobium diazoefficiens]MDA9390149.1 hypothetical protein [Bradyrhizobium sp. CCBAU 45394]MDA9538996.1 hypothetical protein [Bradyrhizobium sp. CCBAU 21362]